MPYQIKYKDTLYNEEWVKEQYLINKLSMSNIANLIGCSRYKVRNALIDYCVVIRDTKESSLLNNIKHPELFDKDWLLHKYIIEKLSTRDIARLLGTGKSGVNKALVRNNIPIRNKKESVKIAFEKTPLNRMAEKHPSWKGGVIVANGRKLIYNPNHPYTGKRKYITETRQILEHHYNCYLEDIGCQYTNCVWNTLLHVHHIDGNKSNNDVNNLVILCPNHHLSIEQNKLKLEVSLSDDSFKNLYKDLIDNKQGIILDVGCGDHKHPGAIGIDQRQTDHADIIHNLEITPWPLLDSCCNTIVCSHILEHITPKYFIDVMNEIHRIGKPGCEVMIASPYGVSPRFLQDPTHCNPITEVTLKYFDPSCEELYAIYKPKPFHIKQCGYDLVHDIHAILTVIKED